MIIEPAPVPSRSPVRRLLRAAGIVAPVVLLALVVAAGLLGPKPSPSPDGPAASDAAVASAVATPGSLPAATPSVGPTLSLAQPASFPATYRTLAAVRPSEVFAERASPAGPPNILVVAGYLGMAGQPTRCAGPMITFGAWCDRPATLSDAPFASLGGGFSGRPPHLQATVPAGVVVPAVVSATSGAAAGTSVPVVVVGRFATPGSCGARPSVCGLGFVVERVVWADGGEVGLQPLFEPGRGAGLSAEPPLSTRLDVIPTLAVLARPATVARLDQAAGAAAARLPSRQAPVWYVRDVIVARDGSLLARWLLLAPDAGVLLATGPADAPSVTLAQPSPAAPPG